ncbi:membrane protein insertase YidC [Ignatzschineria rhizosphaerae]|uniref:Membrane protein insertase YidC n=2 Tax=Ignatzschineria TaxID=112008 RepID=A0ABY3X4Y5_9GAMM|nr:membrane protein insertase YidC [Ignatzschineria rhizosphaerae]UNM96784.1 membrane protein insertase YidC [Ignatzschineria rhizosphaerae]
MQNNQQRLFLLLILAVIIYFLYTKWVEYKNPAPITPIEQTVPGSQQGGANDGSVPVIGGSDQGVPTAMNVEDYITVVTDVYEMKIAKKGGDIIEAGLLQYPESLEEQDKPYKVMDNTQERFQVTRTGLSSQTHEGTPNHTNAVFNSEKNRYELGDAEHLTVPLTYVDPATGLTVTKTYEFTRGLYNVGFSQTLENHSDQVWVGGEYREIATRKPKAQKGAAIGASSFDGSVFSLPNNDFKYEKLAYDKMTTKERGFNAQGHEVTQYRPKEFRGEGGWVAMIEQYFVAASIPGKDIDATKQTQNVIQTLQYGDFKDSSQNTYVIRMMDQSTVTVKPGESYNFESRYYIGPKLKEQLEETAEYLDLTLDFGWFSPISAGMLWLLKFFYSFVGNWGWSIILLTLTVKLALFYFANKGYTSMARMRNVAPKLALIREEYADNRQKQSEEMMKLYRKEKINPLGGCWPIVIQIPVFIALFWMLMESVELRQAPWILWIHDLSKMDPYFILPVIMGITMFFQQRLNPAPTDPMQQKIMKWLPVVFTFMFMWFAAGIVLYWITNNLLTILQQTFIMKRVERDSKKHSA